MANSKAFTIKYNGRVNILVTKCGVSKPTNTSTNTSNINGYNAIWDTGATGTVITSKVAKELGLKPTGVTKTSHAGGSSVVNTYLVNIYLPQQVRIVGVKVTEAQLHGDFELLIGMDIIAHGDFSFSNHNGKSCFSFRLPSVKQIDFVAEQKKPSYLKTSRGYKGGKKRR